MRLFQRYGAALRQSAKVRLATFATLLLIGVGGSFAWRAATAWPKRFSAVDPGRVYRCGEVTPDQLSRIAAEYDLRGVLSLLNPGVPESAAERERALKLGLRWNNVPLTGDGASTSADRDRIRAILRDETNLPLLIHCAAGVNRTGLAVGMYRIHAQHWTIEQVEQELLSTDFENEPQHQNLRDALREEANLAKP